MLQETYKLNVSEFSDGIASSSKLLMIKIILEYKIFSLDGVSYRAERGLKSTDTNFIGKIAFNREFYDRAVDWARVSVDLAETEESEKYMKKILSTMMKHHDKVLDQKGASGSRPGGEQGVWRTYPVPFDEKLRY